MKYSFVAILLFLSLIPSVVFSFDNKETHPRLTEQAILSARIDALLKQNLGIANGVNQMLIFPHGITSRIKSPAPIKEIIKDGAYAEDIPACRAANHFHDPIKNRGLSDVLYSAADPCGVLMPGLIIFPCTPSAINTGIGFLAYCTAKGAIDRQSYIPWNSTVTWASTAEKNEWNWNKTRTYYYNALTSNNPTMREENFAKTFKGLGYILHLLQDMAVPAHVRNDFIGHVVPEWFEKYVSLKSSLITEYPAIEITNAPYTNFWDAGLYDGTNPSNSTLLPGLTASNLMAGLAEYTNANFLSKNTMLTEDYLAYGPYYFPYPRAASTTRWKDATNNKHYLRKSGDGETVEHLAVTSLLYGYRFKYFPQTKLWWPIMLDDKCHYDYAQKLLPRAVGYSAGLLNYFFRGDINMVDDFQTGSGYLIENNSEEDINGVFELWYDTKTDERKQIWKSNGNISLGKKSSGNNKSQNIIFPEPTDAKKSCKYILVFRGQLGQEQDAVVGKVLSVLKCIKVRAVKAGFTKNGDLQIVIYTEENGAIEKVFPRNVVSVMQIKSLRFDVANYDVVMLLDGTNNMHKFRIDETTKNIIYSEKMAIPDMQGSDTAGERTLYCTRTVNIFGSQPQNTNYYMQNSKSDSFYISDVYSENESYKLFGAYYSIDTTYYTPPAITCSGGWNNRSSETYKIVNDEGIIYGGEKTNVISETLNYPLKTCDFKYDIYEASRKIGESYGCAYDDTIQANYNKREVIHPIVVFNAKDYAYKHYYYDNEDNHLNEVIATFPLTLDPYVQMKSLLRRDGGYGFYVYRTQSSNGELSFYDVKSYSTEIGSDYLNGMYLIGEKGIGFAIGTGFDWKGPSLWDWETVIGSVNKIKYVDKTNIINLKTIKLVPPIYIQSEEQFDVGIRYE